MRPAPNRRPTAALMLFALLAASISPAAELDETQQLNKEITFGVKMAQRGLWSEALFRFNRASELRPDEGRILNNLAVAYEALGQFDKALEVYQHALRVDAGNRELKQNYSRFIEFYQAYQPQEDSAQSAGSEPALLPDPDNPSSEGGQ